MRRGILAALGLGATAFAAICAMVATGVVGTSLAVLVGPPLTAPAASAELASFDSCEELRQWYVEAALPYVGPWGLGGLPYIEMDRLSPTTRAMIQSAPTAEAVGSGDTGTNLQEAGVDEPDVAKTDGELVAHTTGRGLVLTDTTGGEPRELSRLWLPKGLYEPELLLVDETLLVLGQPPYGWRLPEATIGRILPPPTTRAETRAVTVDLSDPSAPRITHDDTFSGSLVSAREYDGIIRLVLSTGAPDLDFVTPTGRRTGPQATRQNRAILRASTIEDWLPTVSSGDDTERLLACTDVRHPKQSSGFATISVVSFSAGSPDDRETTAVTASGDLVYSSAGRLYVASSADGWWAEPFLVDARDGEARPARVSTQVHAFALDGLRTEYTASGVVPGRVRDRWSFSEYDGHLRVATALGISWDPRENAVVVLEEQGDRLVTVGRVDDIGIGEEIQSVRWFGPLAVLVTFRQVDPLYTVDLSDPTDPRIVGELKIPGFSAYLHPIGGDMLLGLGQDATREGRSLGAQAAVFDIADLDAPRRLHTEAFRKDTEFVAGRDARAFTYLPERRTAFAPVENYANGRKRVALIRIAEDGSITRTTTEVLGRWSADQVRTLPLDDGRVAVVAGREVTLLTV